MAPWHWIIYILPPMFPYVVQQFHPLETSYPRITKTLGEHRGTHMLQQLGALAALVADRVSRTVGSVE